ncbi:hypothetical protein MD484_g5491, partial [Candolleomyces efflorescens]
MRRKGRKETIRALHRALKEEREELQFLISSLIDDGKGLPVDRDGLRRYAHEKANLQFQVWERGQLVDEPTTGHDTIGISPNVGHDLRIETAIPRNLNEGKITGTLNQGNNVAYYANGYQSPELGPNQPRPLPRHQPSNNHNIGEVGGNVNQGSCTTYYGGIPSQEPPPLG